MRNDYVIGSGISGLLAGYIKGYKVIGPDVGGQLKSPFKLGPRILEKTPEVSDVMHSLGLGISPREFRVGYRYNGRLSDTAPDGFKEKYYMRTRGLEKPDKDIMSSGRNVITGWDIERIGLVAELERQLRARRQLIEGEVKLIDNKLLVIDHRTVFPYDKLISTIPLPKLIGLYQMAPIDHDFTALSTVFIETIPEYPVMGNFDYVYNVGNEPFYRLSKGYKNTVILEMTTSDYYKTSILDLDSAGFKVCDTIIISSCQILHDLDMDSYYDAKLLGRYARWSHKYKIEDVVKGALSC